MSHCKHWTKEGEAKLTELYHNTSNAELAKMFGRNVTAIATKASKMGLKKDPGFYVAHKANGQFKKGAKPWNTGLKLAGTGRVKYKNNWQKGHETWNKRPVGSMRYNGRDGWAVKVEEPNRWISYARYVWELHSGNTVPKGHIVRIKDGNPHNIRYSNLECVSRGQNMKKNGIYTNYPKEVAELMRQVGQMNRVIRNKENEAT